MQFDASLSKKRSSLPPDPAHVRALEDKFLSGKIEMGTLRKKLLAPFPRNPNPPIEMIKEDPSVRIIKDLYNDCPFAPKQTDANTKALFAFVEKFPPEKRRALLVKKGMGIRVHTFESFEDLTTCFRLASFAESTVEQIASLSNTQIKWMGTFLAIYGDTHVQSLWSEPHLEELNDSTQHLPDLSFIEALSPGIKRHFPKEKSMDSSYYNPHTNKWEREKGDGYKELAYLTNHFVGILENELTLPRALQEGLFAQLRPSDRETDVSLSTAPIQAIEVVRLTQCNHLIPDHARITLAQFCKIRSFFTDAAWPNVANGFARLEQLSLTDFISLDNTSLSAIERAGQPGQEEGTKWLTCFLQQGRSYTEKKEGRGWNAPPSYARKTVDLSSIESIDTCIRYVRTYFVPSVETVARFLDLSPQEQKVLAIILDGSIVTRTEQPPDLSLIEGVVLELGQKFQRLEEDARRKEGLEMFKTLSIEEQNRYFIFPERFGTVKHRLALTKHENSEQLARLVKSMPNGHFTSEAGLRMAARPDCMGLFYYLEGGYEDAHQFPLIHQLITLKDAGLPPSFFAKTPHEYGTITRGSYTDDEALLLSRDPTRLAALAQYATQVGYSGHLLELLKLEESIPDHAREQLVRKAAIKKVESLFYDENVPPPFDEELDMQQERINTAERLLGAPLSATERRNILEITPAGWDHIQHDPDIVRHAVKSPSMLDVIEHISIDDLQNSLFWKLDVDDTFALHPDHLHRALTLLTRFTSLNIIYKDVGSSRGDASWKRMLEAQERAPWLFTDEVLQQYSGRLSVLVPLSEAPQELYEQIFASPLKKYAVTRHNVKRCLDTAFTGQLIITETERQELAEYVGTPIPWELAEDLQHDMNKKGMRIHEILAHLISIEKASEECTYVSGNSWLTARAAYVDGQLAARDTSLLARCGDRYHGEANIQLKERLVHLPDYAIANLVRMPSDFEIRRSTQHQDIEKFFLIITQESFDLALPCIEQSEGYSIMKSSVSELKTFFEKLTPEHVERYLAFPKDITMRLVDIPAFFSDPNADKIITFGAQIKPLLDPNTTLSVYDLLIMDFEKDAALLTQLQQQCALPLDLETVHALTVTAEEKTQETLSKLLSINGSKIDTFVAMRSLERVSPALRASVIRDKGADSFGWTILKFRDQLEGEMGCTKETMDQLVKDLYKRGDVENMELDYQAALVLLDIVMQSSSTIQDVSVVFEKYRGAWPELLTSVFSRDNKTLSHFFQIFQNTNAWEKLPLTMKEDPSFWPLFAEKMPSLVLQYLQEKPEHIAISPTMIDAYIVEGGSLGFLQTSQTSTSETDKAVAAQKRQHVQQRLDTLATEWSESPKTAVTIFERIVATDAFEPRYFQVIYDMLIAAKNPAANEGSVIDTARMERIFAEAVLHIDPSVRKTFTDPTRLGNLREFVLNQLVQYTQSLNAQDTGHSQETGVKTNTNQQTAEVFVKLRRKLLEIKRVFESSSASDSQRRLLFLDMYPLETCNDPSVADLRGTPDILRKRIQKDVQDILVYSGSAREMRALRATDLAKVDPEERARIEVYLAQQEGVLKTADQRNRHQTDLLPGGALTHGTNATTLPLIFEGGNFSGELIGSQSKADQSGLFGMDVSTITEPASGTFAERYNALNNGSYGNVLMIYGAYQESTFAKDRPVYYRGKIGTDHHLLRCGIPNSEITALVARHDGLVEELKKEVATYGGFIPIVDAQGKQLFSEAEFDEMRVFYYDLTKRGYPRKIVEDVYTYFRSPTKGPKHTHVMQKAFEAAKIDTKGTGEDLAILVSFLRSNDLNAKDESWYAAASFVDIMSLIRHTTAHKLGGKARTLLWNQPLTEEPRSIATSITDIKHLKETGRRPNAFLDAFFKKQLPFLEAQERAPVYERAITDILFHRGWKSAEEKPDRTAEIEDLFAQEKRQIMQKLWEQVWTELDQDETFSPEYKQRLKEYHETIIPVLTGSAGRREVVLGSDLDYLLLVDDTTTPLVDEDALKIFVNTVLAQRMNAVLAENGIMGDAGLAKEDRAPFTKLSTLKTFQIDVRAARQKEEPTNIVDADALFENPVHQGVVARAKEALIMENPTSHLLDGYIMKELEVRSETYPSYMERFEELYQSFASGTVLNKIKESLQRVIVFKVYQLLFEGIETGKIPKEEVATIPASTRGKLALLEKYRVLSHPETKVTRELLGLVYRLRFAGELYSREAGEAEATKVTNVRFRVEDLSYNERAELFSLLKDFKTEVLYK